MNPVVSWGSWVSRKLKDHRDEPGGVAERVGVRGFSRKLKDHRDEPGGVAEEVGVSRGSGKLRDHRDEPGGVITMFFYVTIGFVLVVSLVVLWIAVKSRRHKQHVSSNDLIGATAMVDQPLNPRGSVIVEGEVWLAISATGEILPTNTSVNVVRIQEQFLVVEAKRTIGH